MVGEPERVPERIDEDRPLVDLARQGDRDAFGRLVIKYQHRAVNFARGITASAADAEDVAQEAFIRAYRALGQFHGASTFRTWFYQIVVNVARTSRSKAVSRRETADANIDDWLAARPTSENVERQVIDRDRLDRALRTLAPELREALVLRDVEGLDYREIATLLDVPMGTVESRIFRGRVQMRRVLKETS